MKLNRALTEASRFMLPAPARLRDIARALAERQAAQPPRQAPPLPVPAANPDNAPKESALGASLASMQASHGLLTRAIDMLK